MPRALALFALSLFVSLTLTAVTTLLVRPEARRAAFELRAAGGPPRPHRRCFHETPGGLFGAILLVGAFAAPVAMAADEALPHTGRVLMAFGGDVAVPADEQADVVFVANGDADIAGTVNTLTVIEGNATLHGATVETIVIVSGTLALEEGTTVIGNVRSIESTVTQAEGVEIAGDIKGVDAELIALGAFLGPAALLFALGMFLASLVAGLLLVAMGTRQVRAAERVIAAEPLKVFGPACSARSCPDPGDRGHRHDRRRSARARDPARRDAIARVRRIPGWRDLPRRGAAGHPQGTRRCPPVPGRGPGDRPPPGHRSRAVRRRPGNGRRQHPRSRGDPAPGLAHHAWHGHRPDGDAEAAPAPIGA